MLSLDATSGPANAVGNAVTLSLTTTLANDVIVVWTALVGGDAVTSVTSSSGLTWTLRHADAGVAIYSAVKAVAGSETITVNLNYGGSNNACAIAINGANVSSPWDPDASLPVYVPGTDVTNVATYSTDNPNDFVFFVSYLNSPGYTLPAGFTSIFTNAPGLCAAYQIVSTAQSNTQVSVFGYPSFISLDVVTGAPVVVNYVDLAGNLGGASHYGKLSFGQKLYSRDPAFAPSLSANLDIVGQQYFDGDLSPVIAFAGALDVLKGLSGGDLAPQITFAADLSLIIGLSGDLAPQIGLQALLGLDLPLQGNLPVNVALAGSALTAGPLWPPSTPCPSPPWAPDAPCPPSLWTPEEPCAPVDWEETELCNG